LERSFYKALSELRRTQLQREPAEAPAAKQTQSDEQPPDPTPPPVASEPSEIRNPTSEIPPTPAAKQTKSEDQPSEPAPPQTVSDPAPQPERSEIQHPSSN